MLETNEEKYGFYSNYLDFLTTPTGANAIELLKEKIANWEIKLGNISKKMQDQDSFRENESEFLKIKSYIKVYKELLESDLYDIENCKSYVEYLKKEIMTSE